MRDKSFGATMRCSQKSTMATAPKPDPIDDAEAGRDADQRKKNDRYDMKNTRQPQCGGSAESHRNRMEALFTVEIAILE